ncbi:hypothetical protein CIB84_007154, partial [Bambusicola thoracicus]
VIINVVGKKTTMFLFAEKPAIAPPVFVFQKDKAQKFGSAFTIGLEVVNLICNLCRAPCYCVIPLLAYFSMKLAGTKSFPVVFTSVSLSSFPVVPLTPGDSWLTPRDVVFFYSQSPAEQKALSESGEDPQGEVEPPRHALGHKEPAEECDPHLPAPAVALASDTLSRAAAAQLAPIQQELAGRSADGSSPEDGDESDREDGNYCPPVKRERTSSLTQFPPSQSGKC